MQLVTSRILPTVAVALSAVLGGSACASSGGGEDAEPRIVIVEVTNTIVPAQEMNIWAVGRGQRAIRLGRVRANESAAFNLEVRGFGIYSLVAAPLVPGLAAGDIRTEVTSERFRIPEDAERVVWDLRSNFLRVRKRAGPPDGA